jgi:hypothetical protein
VPVAAAVAVLLLAGVGLTAFLITRGGTPTAGAAPAQPASSGPTASADHGQDAAIIDAQTDGRFGTGGARFVTPSGNIACMMTADEVRCDVARRTWTTPPTPADCDGAYGTGASLTGSGPGVLTCVGDTVADPALKVLAYDQGVRYAGVVCVSRETGLRCENTSTGHGFQVARATYDLF